MKGKANTRSDKGKKRLARLTSKLFDHRKWTISVLGVYTAALGVLKEYVCLFQRRQCLVHKLHDEQLSLFKQFLANFVKPECFAELGCSDLKSTNVLPLNNKGHLLSSRRMYIGTVAENELKSYGKKDPLRLKFLEMVQSAYIKCGQTLQQKLPLTNKLLRSMAALDPCTDHSQSSTLAAFEDLPELVTNVLTVDVDQLGTGDDESTTSSLEREMEKKHIDLRDSYNREVRTFCTRLDHPPSEEDGVQVPVDEWWAKIGQSGRYPHLHAMVSSLLTCFHGLAVESSFSSMADVVDAKSNRMHVATYSSIQTSVKYALRSSKKSAVEGFKRTDKMYSPVNHRLCVLMRGASSARKAEQKKQRNILQEKRLALSLKHQQFTSKQNAIARRAELAKKERVNHRRLQLEKMKALVQMRKEKAGQKRKAAPEQEPDAPRPKQSTVQ